MNDTTRAFDIAAALAGAIKTLGSVPAGVLYVRCAGNLTLEQFESAIRVLVCARMVHREPSHLLVWIGEEGGEPFEHYMDRQARRTS
jgi:hypothetical protein